MLTQREIELIIKYLPIELVNQGGDFIECPCCQEFVDAPCFLLVSQTRQAIENFNHAPDCELPELQAIVEKLKSFPDPSITQLPHLTQLFPAFNSRK